MNNFLIANLLHFCSKSRTSLRNLTLTKQICDISQSFVSAIKYENISNMYSKYKLYREIEKKKIIVGCDQKFQLAIRENFNYQMSVLKVRLVILRTLKS
jgi:hypothetical protein